MNFKKLAPSSSGFGQLFRTLLCAHAQNAHITNRLLSISYKAVPKLCKLCKKAWRNENNYNPCLQIAILRRNK